MTLQDDNNPNPADAKQVRTLNPSEEFQRRFADQQHLLKALEWYHANRNEMLDWDMVTLISCGQRWRTLADLLRPHPGTIGTLMGLYSRDLPPNPGSTKHYSMARIRGFFEAIRRHYLLYQGDPEAFEGWRPEEIQNAAEAARLALGGKE